MNPLLIIKQATDKVPVVKYALGIAGIVAGIALIKSFQVSNSDIPIIGILTILALMILLFLFSVVSKSKAPILQYCGYALIITTTVLTCISATLLATSAFAEWPKPLDQLLRMNESTGNKNVDTNYRKVNPVVEWKASEMSHACGSAVNDYWISTPGEDCWPWGPEIGGYVIYGPYSALDSGQYSIDWELALGQSASSLPNIGYVNVRDSQSGDEDDNLGVMEINRDQFPLADVFKLVGFTFHVKESRHKHRFEFRVYTEGHTPLKIRKVILTKIS